MPDAKDNNVIRNRRGAHCGKAGEVVIFSISLGLTVPSLFMLMRSGFLEEQLSDWRSWVMYAELLAVGVLLLALELFRSRSRGTLAGTNADAARGTPDSGQVCLLLEMLIVCLFLWAHRIFLPLVVTGAYCAGLTAAGEMLFLPLRRKEGIHAACGVRRLAHNFLTGCAAMIVFLCFLSGIHAGGTGTARKAALFLIVLSLLLLALCKVSGWLPLEYEEIAEDRGNGIASGVAGDKDGGIASEIAGGRTWRLRSGITAERLMLLGILVILLLHAGRMNITLDYDSVHYGLRTPYILDNGFGIFENLGSVNTVYYYPKGLEVLTLPLSGTPTYGFVLSFSFWCGVFFLILTADIAAGCFGRKAGISAAFCCALIPGIMNLSTSAKTDMVTLLFQMLSLGEMLAFFGETAEIRESTGAAGTTVAEDGVQVAVASLRPAGTLLRSAVWSAAALMFTLALKPTSVAFSGLLFLAAAAFGCFCLFPRRNRRKAGPASQRPENETGHRIHLNPEQESVHRTGFPIAAACLILLLPFTAVLGVTLRTLHLTGYPLVTVFTGIWEKLGMHGHYPLAVQNVPDSSAGLGAAGTVLYLLRRLFAILVCPWADEDLHILIAWGTTLFPALLAAVAVAMPREFRAARMHFMATEPGTMATEPGTMATEPSTAATAPGTAGPGAAYRETVARTAGGTGGECRARRQLHFLLLTLAGFLVFDLVTLKLLYQVDGNYYNLTYALTAVAAAALWRREAGAARDSKCRQAGLLRALSPAILMALFMTSITNWAGARGLTELKLNHYGFYDHASDVTDYMILNGKEPIYRYLKNAPRIHLLTMSEEPECYLFPCRAESYTDLEGSGGNVRLVKTLNEFKDYLEWAGITYLYTEQSFLPEHPRAEEIVRFMEEDGSISVVITQEGCTLYEYHAGIRD